MIINLLQIEYLHDQEVLIMIPINMMCEKQRSREACVQVAIGFCGFVGYGYKCLCASCNWFLWFCWVVVFVCKLQLVLVVSLGSSVFVHVAIANGGLAVWIAVVANVIPARLLLVSWCASACNTQSNEQTEPGRHHNGKPRCKVLDQKC